VPGPLAGFFGAVKERIDWRIVEGLWYVSDHPAVELSPGDNRELTWTVDRSTTTKIDFTVTATGKVISISVDLGAEKKKGVGLGIKEPAFPVPAKTWYRFYVFREAAAIARFKGNKMLGGNQIFFTNVYKVVKYKKTKP
jgi:hypothetical protein